MNIEQLLKAVRQLEGASFSPSIVYVSHVAYFAMKTKGYDMNYLRKIQTWEEWLCETKNKQMVKRLKQRKDGR